MNLLMVHHLVSLDTSEDVGRLVRVAQKVQSGQSARIRERSVPQRLHLKVSRRVDMATKAAPTVSGNIRASRALRLEISFMFRREISVLSL
jgi:hypothetical protein